jgi:ABC-type glycerol-3-phosphate transport system permease component
MDSTNHTSSFILHHPSTDLTSFLRTRLLELWMRLPAYTWSDLGTSLLRNLVMVVASMMLSSFIAYGFALSLRGRGKCYD